MRKGGRVAKGCSCLSVENERSVIGREGAPEYFGRFKLVSEGGNDWIGCLKFLSREREEREVGRKSID